ncbi:hypothetical protein [Balnearium lithotrophicum]|uniref:hypothetical protein n=1 Tax=Balnearium lithotrophicum TaxID=223788 RepID=UPI00163DE64A|nr:hypothetical protein [Balnearium lithotrophicum]
MKERNKSEVTSSEQSKQGYIKKGYQPTQGNLGNPPQGGSGVPPKSNLQSDKKGK